MASLVWATSTSRSRFKIFVTLDSNCDLSNFLYLQDLELSPSLVRANVRDITLAEPAMRELDYQGMDLPILTEQELLEQTWNLEEQPRVEGQDVEASGERESGQSKRARDKEEGSEPSRTKRPRVDVEVPQEET